MSYYLSVIPRPPPKSPLFPYTTLFRSCENTRVSIETNPKELISGLNGIIHSAWEKFKPLKRFTMTPLPVPYFRLKGNQLMLGYRSEEHTSELQSRENLVCRLLLEKKRC